MTDVLADEAEMLDPDDESVDADALDTDTGDTDTPGTADADPDTNEPGANGETDAPGLIKVPIPSYDDLERMTWAQLEGSASEAEAATLAAHPHAEVVEDLAKQIPTDAG